MKQLLCDQFPGQVCELRHVVWVVSYILLVSIVNSWLLLLATRINKPHDLFGVVGRTLIFFAALY